MAWTRYILVAVVVLFGALLPAGLHAQSMLDIERAAFEAQRPLEVHLLGNELLPDSELEAAIDVPDDAAADEQTARTIEEQLREYFAEAGFKLARVEAVVFDEALWVFVDEGKLDRVFFSGAGTIRTARLQIAFDLPADIFNSASVDRQLARLREEHGLQRLEATLIEEEVARPAQLDRALIAALEESPQEALEVWREAGDDFSLRIFAVSEEWGSGFDFGLGLLGPYGLEIEVGYSNTDLFAAADRYSTEIVLGGLSDTLFTHAEAELFYATPELFEESVRPAVDLDANLENLDRDSLFLDRYLYLQTDAVALVGFEPWADLVIAPGVGVGYDHILQLEPTEATPSYVIEEERWFPIGQIGLEWLIGQVRFRRDMLHLLEAIVEVRTVDEGLWARFEGDYQKAWGFGFHDLFVRSNFFSFVGDGIEWFDEDPIASQVLRAVAGDHDFARNLLAAGAEFRFSLYDDVLKAGLSGAGAAAGLQNRQTRDQFLAFLASGGPGLHVQFLGNFQLNLYYHLGWRDDGSTAGQFSLKLWKVY